MNGAEVASDGPAAAAGPQRPNILYVFPDQFRRQALAHEGGPVPTPHLDRLASEGASFARAYCAYPMCTPSRAAMLTGRPCHALRDHAGAPYLFNDRQLELHETTYATALTEAGYQCSYIGKWHLDGRDGFVPPGPRRRGFDDAFYLGGHLTRPFHYDDEGQRVGGDREVWAPDYQTDLALNYLRQRTADDAPFCLTISYSPPHAPYDVLSRDRLPLFDQAREIVQDVRPNVPDNLHDTARQINRQYHALVMGLDDCVGRLLDGLDQLGLAENTIVVFTSDHGDSLLSHGCRGKNQFWEEAAGVPLLVRWPGHVPAGLRVDGPVGHVDLAPTLLDLAGIAVPRRMMGDSLKRSLLNGSGHTGREAAFIEINHPWWDWIYGQGWQGHRRCVVTDRWKLVVRATESGTAEPHELYDLSEDPFEQHDRVAEPGMIPRITCLGQQLLSWMARTDDPFFDVMLGGMGDAERHRNRLKFAGPSEHA